MGAQAQTAAAVVRARHVKEGMTDTRVHPPLSTETEPCGGLCIRTLAMPADTNGHGDIFGGWLLSRMDGRRRVRVKDREIAHGDSCDRGDEISASRSMSAISSRCTAAQFALRRRKAGISRTSSSLQLRMAGERPYGSSPCGAAWCADSVARVAGLASGWRVVGESGGFSGGAGNGAPCAIRSTAGRLVLPSLPASCVSEPPAGCAWRGTPTLSMPVATTETRTMPSRRSSKVAPHRCLRRPATRR